MSTTTPPHRRPARPRATTWGQPEPWELDDQNATGVATSAERPPVNIGE